MHVVIFISECIKESNWPILLTILTSKGYRIKRPSEADIQPVPQVVRNYLRISDIEYNESLKRIKSNNSVFKITGKDIKFASSGIKQAVMSKFVESCLKSDEDLQTYIETSSTDSLMEYCRLWNYRRDEGKACLFIPEKIKDEYIRRLNEDAVFHVMVEEREDSDGRQTYIDTRDMISKLREYITIGKYNYTIYGLCMCKERS